MDDHRRALEWIAGRYCSQHWVTDIARAALEGKDLDAAIKKAEADIDRYLHGPVGPSTLDGAYSQMGSGWGNGRL